MTNHHEGADIPSGETRLAGSLSPSPLTAVTHIEENVMKMGLRFIVLLPEATQIAQFILLARLVADKMTNNPHFPAPFVPLPLFKEHIDTFEADAIAAEGGGAGAIDQRNASMVVVSEDLSALRAYVQRVGSTYPATEVESVIKSAAMEVRKKTKQTKEPVSVRHGKTSGSAVLEARALPRPASYWWQMSTDGETWTALPETFKTRISVNGLTPATTYHFRVRSTTNDGMTEWSQVVRLIAL